MFMVHARRNHGSRIGYFPNLMTTTTLDLISRFGSISFINELNVCGMGMLGFDFCICFVLLHSRALRGFGLVFGLV